MPGSVSPQVAFLLLWLTLPVVKTAFESVISLEPPWTTFFRGETVTLTCYRFGFYLPQKTKWWYPKGKKPGEIQQHTIEVRESGEYRCQADSLSQSMPVHLDFFNAPLVLRAPPAVFEGDPLTLKCQAKKGKQLKPLEFYKNDKALTLPDGSSELRILHANQKANGGVYRCSDKNWGIFRDSSNKVRIQVQELFPYPVLLRARPSQPVDGSPVTLTCQTQLPAQRSNIQLRFCFTRNLQVLGSGCSNSSEIHIPAIWIEDSKSYWCKAETANGQTRKKSWLTSIPVQRAFADFQVHVVPASKLVFEGQLLLFNCSVRGIPGPIKFSWYKRDKLNKEIKIRKSSEAKFNISTVNSGDAGDYYCEASNSRRSFVSKTVPITVKVPASQPILTLSTGEIQALEGDLITLHCKSQRGSPHILYEFYHENVSLGSNCTLSGGEASFSFTMTTEHSGNYSCTADNGLGAQRSEAVRISIIVPVSRPVLTLTVPGAQAVVGDVVELHCEALGSPPILYHFYHQNVSLGNSSAPAGGRGSFNFSVTMEHSGNFYCVADNGQRPQHSEPMTLSVIGKKRSAPVAAGLTGGLLGTAGMAAGVLLFRCWFSRKARREPALDDSRSPSDSEPQEPTYYNVPAWIELQPVYSNDPEGDVIYSEVQNAQWRCKHEVASELGIPTNKESPIIYAQVKLASTPAPSLQKLASSAPHR